MIVTQVLNWNERQPLRTKPQTISFHTVWCKMAEEEDCGKVQISCFGLMASQV